MNVHIKYWRNCLHIWTVDTHRRNNIEHWQSCQKTFSESIDEMEPTVIPSPTKALSNIFQLCLMSLCSFMLLQMRKFDLYLLVCLPRRVKLHGGRIPILVFHFCL